MVVQMIETPSTVHRFEYPHLEMSTSVSSEGKFVIASSNVYKTALRCTFDTNTNLNARGALRRASTALRLRGLNYLAKGSLSSQFRNRLSKNDLSTNQYESMHLLAEAIRLCDALVQRIDILKQHKTSIAEQTA